MTYRIENVYRVWDTESSCCITIQEDGEPGSYRLDTDQITVEQIPGIIEVLTRLKDTYECRRKFP